MLNLGVPPVENSDTCTCKALKPFLNDTFKKQWKNCQLKKCFNNNNNNNNNVKQQIYSKNSSMFLH